METERRRRVQCEICAVVERDCACAHTFVLCRLWATSAMCGVYPGPRVPSTYTLHDCTCSTSRSTTRTVRMQCLFVVDRLIGTMIMYNEFCHVCSRTTRIPVTLGFQEKIRFRGIFHSIAGLREWMRFLRMVGGMLKTRGKFASQHLLQKVKPWQ